MFVMFENVSTFSNMMKLCEVNEDVCCVVLWCGVVWCGVVWCGVVWCGVVWCGVVWCGVVWCGVVWCGVVWCGVVWCNMMCYVVRETSRWLWQWWRDLCRSATGSAKRHPWLALSRQEWKQTTTATQQVGVFFVEMLCCVLAFLHGWWDLCVAMWCVGISVWLVLGCEWLGFLHGRRVGPLCWGVEGWGFNRAGWTLVLRVGVFTQHVGSILWGNCFTCMQWCPPVHLFYMFINKKVDHTWYNFTVILCCMVVLKVNLVCRDKWTYFPGTLALGDNMVILQECAPFFEVAMLGIPKLVNNP